MIHQPFLKQYSYGQFKEHGAGYQEYHGSGFPEQGEPKLMSNRNGVPDGQGNSRTHYLIGTVVGFPILHSLIFY